MEYVETGSREPQYNLAFEEALLRHLPGEHAACFLLWQNNPCIIVGRHQCVPGVVNAEFIEKNSIPVIRRVTGGGAVYHDLGNLNFSFIMPARGKKDFTSYLQAMLEALKLAGIPAEISGRNDLEVAGKKISGCARIILDDRELMHGTLLVNTDLVKLSSALKVRQEKLSSKGVASIRSRVTNISEMAAGMDISGLKKILRDFFTVKEFIPDGRIVEEAQRLAEQKYSRWEWNYGQSPPFNLQKYFRFPWGEVEVFFDVRHGRVKSCAINGDFFYNEEISGLENRFLNMDFNPESLDRATRDVKWEDYFMGCDKETMRKFFTHDLFS